MKSSQSLSVAMPGHTALFPNTPRYKQTRLWTWGRRTRLGELTRSCKRFHKELWSWLSYERVRFPNVAQLAQSIALLETRGFDTTNVETDQAAPIFALSSAGRSGSTLLQRILITDPRVMIWGEPQGEMALVARLAEMISHLEQPEKLGVWDNHKNTKSPEMATSWIAQMYPSITYFRASLRSLFDQWLGKPAQDRGYSRWGFKDVRLSATEAVLLHWLYPKAKFVITSRHPYNSYRSFADARRLGFNRYPDIKIDSAVSFAYHWNRQAMSWFDLPAEFPCFHMKYEDLTKGKVDFRKLESWLGLEIKEKVALSAPVGGTAKRKKLSWYERSIIAREAESGMRALGYEK